MAGETSPAVPTFSDAPEIRASFSARVEKKPISKNYYEAFIAWHNLSYTPELQEFYTKEWGLALPKFEMRRAVFTASGKRTYRSGSEIQADIEMFMLHLEVDSPEFRTAALNGWSYNSTDVIWFADSLNVADQGNGVAVSSSTYKGVAPWEFVRVVID